MRSLRGQVRRDPVIESAALEVPAGFICAERVLRRMAAAAMAQAVDEIGAAIPFGRLAGIGLEIMRVQVQQIPTLDHGAKVERERQIVFWRRVFDRRRGLQKSQNRIVIFAADEREPRIGKGGVEIASLIVDAVVHGAVELIGGPIADSGVFVGGDIGSVDHAERGLESQPAGQGFAPIAQVAGHAVARRHQILPAPQLRCVRRRVRRSAALRRSTGSDPGRIRICARQERLELDSVARRNTHDHDRDQRQDADVSIRNAR